VYAAVVWLAGCGTPGAPRPPSLRLPETVRDLAAWRQGNRVTLTWTESQRTTDGETIRALGPTLVCMGVNDFPMTHCDQVAADLSQSQYAQCAPKVGQSASCQVTLALELQGKYPLGQATYAIEVMNTNGRSAGLSNQVRVPTLETATPPRNIRAEVTPDGVVIDGYREELPHIPNVAFIDHVYRREENGTALIDLGAALSFYSGKNVYPKFTDRTAEWEKTYFYQFATISLAKGESGENVEVKGALSPEVKVYVHDIFPPATPVGVQAVASGVGQQPFVDLTWAPNTDSDLAGYNVYRRAETVGPPVGKIVEFAMTKLNFEPVKTPSYRDGHVQSGMKYFYVVTAVDLRGNESSKSTEASETVH
jgi:hypothetical protein